MKKWSSSESDIENTLIEVRFLTDSPEEFTDFYIEQWLFRKNECPCCGEFLKEEEYFK